MNTADKVAAFDEIVAAKRRNDDAWDAYAGGMQDDGDTRQERWKKVVQTGDDLEAVIAKHFGPPGGEE